jgi:DNA-binding SARP family transcriptional activator
MIESQATSVVMHFLGVPEVRYLGQPVHFASRKSLALLVYLTVEAGWHGREKLIALFWPESDQKRGRTSLRTAVTRLRQSLFAAADLILVDGDRIAVDHEWPFMLDLQLVKTAVLTNTIEACQQGLSAFRGEFLDGFTLPDTPAFDQWVNQRRLFWQHQRDVLFERLCRWQLEHGETAQAVQTASQWIVRGPLSETAYRLLMEAHFLDGDRTAALQVYETCVQMLHDELGVTATAATTNLAARIRSISPPRRRDSTAVKAKRSIELPLVGRHAEHGQLATDYRQIALGATRMVVLIGEAGIGKTTLARAFLNWATVADPGADTLQGRAFETGGRLPYQPVV